MIRVVALLGLAFFTSVASAQVRSDSAFADSLPPDTIDVTARFLEAQSQVAEQVAVMPRLERPGPHPALTRHVFTRDSIEWGHVETIGDLLVGVPGVYMWRGGWIGQPEPLNFQGRGATSVEYYLDGIPYLPAGVDSVGVDPALFALSFFDRVEVERWPGLLRVFLFTRRHDRLAPYSRIAIARGDDDFARYQGTLQRRFRSGAGFVVAAELLDAPTATAASSDFKATQYWVQGGYVPSPRIGVQYQIVGTSPERDPLLASGSGGAPVPVNDGLEGNRTDVQIRGFWRRRADGLGLGADLVYARTGWGGSDVEQQNNQFGGLVSYRTPTASVNGSAFLRSRWTSLDLRAGAGWAPISLVALSGEGVYQRHDGDRTSAWVGLRAGLRLPARLALSASARLGQVVAAPAIEADTAQDLRDFRVALGWESRPLGLELGFSHTAAFAPAAYQAYPDVPSLGQLPPTDWITLAAQLRPTSWLTLDGWYSDPYGDPRAGLPPTHALVSGTIRSQFRRTFPSGTLELLLKLSMESWGSGVQGFDGGQPIPLPGATFFRSLVQMRLGSFVVYWDRVNLTATSATYVPGFQIPPYGSTFGVRWEFLN